MKQLSGIAWKSEKSLKELEVPRIISDNNCMMNENNNEVTWNDFKNAIERLTNIEHGDTVYCWLRRRATAHYEYTHDGYEELGSSDVTCHLFELWKQYIYSLSLIHI